jgi:hypothetical protein
MTPPSNPEKNNNPERVEKFESLDSSPLTKIKESIWPTASEIKSLSKDLLSSKNEIDTETTLGEKASEELNRVESETSLVKKRYTNELIAALTSLATLTQAEPLPENLPTRQDSLLLLQNTKELLAFYGSDDYEPHHWEKDIDKERFSLVYPDNYDNSFDKLKKLIPEYKASNEPEEDANFISKASLSQKNISPEELRGKFKVDGKFIHAPEGIFLYGDEDNPNPGTFIHPDAPSAIYHEDIKTDKIKVFKEKDRRTAWEKIKDENPFNVIENGKTTDLAYVSTYDPLKITPWDQLTDDEKIKRREKYGDTGTPFDKSIKKEKVEVEHTQENTPETSNTEVFVEKEPDTENKKEVVFAKPVMGIEQRPPENIPKKIRISRAEYLAKENDSYKYIYDEVLAKKGDPFPYFKVEKEH